MFGEKKNLYPDHQHGYCVVCYVLRVCGCVRVLFCLCYVGALQSRRFLQCAWILCAIVPHLQTAAS